MTPKRPSKGRIGRGLKWGRIVRKTRLKASKRPVERRRRKKGELTKLKDKLWDLCKLRIKERDGFKCFTCGKVRRKKGALHTGHFITSSTCSMELRYDLKNLARQCYHCNINLSGNWHEFEKRLIAKYGQAYVTELKERNDATKGRLYTKEWFENKIAELSNTSI